jgi:hypothetical protein
MSDSLHSQFAGFAIEGVTGIVLKAHSAGQNTVQSPRRNETPRSTTRNGTINREWLPWQREVLNIYHQKNERKSTEIA